MLFVVIEITALTTMYLTLKSFFRDVVIKTVLMIFKILIKLVK